MLNNRSRCAHNQFSQKIESTIDELIEEKAKKMMRTKAFKGANVFLSRKLVPPEIFDALHDALNHNAAQLFLCCDPSRNGPNDFHVISSPDHEKFEDLQAQGCNLLGPQCVLSCAKENRPLPKQPFTCCLAMDGVKVLASGFEMDEKEKIVKLVTAMGGVLHSKSSLDVSFVIVKNVLAAKYKWALNILKKPIVNMNWLQQCWTEHRVVPQEPYRVLPFSGLTICVTRVPADERKEIEKFVMQNGGKYSAELTRNCTHLISDAPEGDKYIVARRWGHIHIVTRKWFDQSIARRGCLTEESYPVHGGSVFSTKTMRCSSIGQHSQDRGLGNLQSAPSSVPAELNLPAVPCTGFADLDLENILSQNMSSMFSDATVLVKGGDAEMVTMQPTNETNLDGCVANDSQSEDNDLYLSECRILLVGFEAGEMRKLVNMVRRGGGSRYMLFNDKLTHIVVGTPSEIEKKEVRSLAALGVIHVVRTTWLEDCDREKKEFPVYGRHIAYDLLRPKDSVHSTKGATTGVVGVNQSKRSVIEQSMSSDQLLGSLKSETEMTSSLNNREEINVNRHHSIVYKNKGQQKLQHDSSAQDLQNKKLSTVFKGRIFCFSNSFPEDRRAEVVQWVNQGGGELVDNHVLQNVHFTIECHGVKARAADFLQTTYVSSHWIRSCLEYGCLLDVGSHVLYSPLPCHIPLPGFESFRFCVSQYEEKDRLLLRNLCFVLGAKFVGKLNKKVTHLICKFRNGPKYEAASKWGIHSITSEWIYQCIRENDVVSLDPFCPREVTIKDQEAGVCTVSQFPTQAARMISGENTSQFISLSQEQRNASRNDNIIGSGIESFREESNQSSLLSKRAKLMEDDGQEAVLSSGVHLSGPSCEIHSNGDDKLKDNGEVSHVVPDVAAAIEDLLEQTSKIHDQKSPGRTGCDKSVSCRDVHSVTGLSKHWSNRTLTKDEISNASRNANSGIYDGFSETQTESQVVVYEEDLSGRQMLIDRVLTRSSMT
ncbi:BRCT domain-containing protein/PTCB-BRCT domain-containing protein [Cephalotus follicularis]|uniref:BRCT domain-containing protein/PTCB-BRCT domain-containing protein n=1 Tax=Cephalotus follicularis TaxID=3775 RepID=A0A1Q3D0H7_CEPFO|nr:BRCT domain-containing protein/PTCB-BRCT domain-containing protein [Cephalotus follicularis]